MKNKKQAFTLAEVLLVLAIIGVIAAVTIPAIMQQSSEKKFSALAKKSASTIQNAIDLKLATEPIGPGDYGVGLLAWLADGDDNGTNTLKIADANADSSVIQTPDGAIIYWGGGKCNGETSATNRLGCNSGLWMRIDLNGSDPPTKTTVDNAKTTIGDNYSQSNPKDYDIIHLWIQSGTTKLIPTESTSAVHKRTRKYLGIDVKY